MDFDIKERVRSAFDIVDVIGAQLELRPQGRAFVARCPWHNDKRPSLQVNPQRQTWKCWVCNIGGDVFSYVMQRDGVDFGEALKTLAEKAGIELQSSNRKKASPGSPDDKSALQAALQFAVNAYYEFLQSDSSAEAAMARDYLASRGIDDASRERYLIGYGPAHWSWLIDRASAAGHRADVLKAAGLASQRSSGSGFYDFFRGRLMFPIHDLQGRPISLGGRFIPRPGGNPISESDEALLLPNAKYINGPETLLFNKSRQLYGLHLARSAMQRTGHVLVMEGYTDVIATRQAGIEPVVAVLGTALGENHIELLRRFVDRVVLVLDGDEAGRTRADQVLELFVSANVDLRIITLPGNADPAEFVEQYGREALDQLVQDAPDALEHKLATLTAGVDLTHDTHQASRALQKMIDVVAAGGNRNALRTGQMLVRLSRTFGFPVEDLRKQLDASIQRTSARYRSSPERLTIQEAVATPVAAPKRPSLDLMNGMERELFEIMIEDQTLAALAIETIDPAWLHSETSRQLFQLYRELELQGYQLDFATVMNGTEHEGLKNQLVSLDEAMQKRSGFMTLSSQERYKNLLNRFQQSQTHVDSRRKLAKLEDQSLDDDEAARLLDSIIKAQRAKHGIAKLE